jgi:hypothetical protein
VLWKTLGEGSSGIDQGVRGLRLMLKGIYWKLDLVIWIKLNYFVLGSMKSCSVGSVENSNCNTCMCVFV